MVAVLSSTEMFSIAEEPVIANCIIKKLNEGKVKCFEWDASPPLDEISLGWSQQCVKTLVPLRHLAEDRSKFPHHKDF